MMKEINVQIGEEMIKGFSPDIELKVEGEKRPWWRIIEYAKGHHDYKENTTTLAMIDKTGIEVTLSLKNGCDSLKEILSCDPCGENKFEVQKIGEPMMKGSQYYTSGARALVLGSGNAEHFTINGIAYDGIKDGHTITVSGKSSDMADIFEIYRKSLIVPFACGNNGWNIKIIKIEKQIVRGKTSIIVFECLPV